MAVGYVRVSTDEQATCGVGLIAQESRIRAYARTAEVDIEEIIADDGYSGSSLDRPGLARLLAMAREESVDTVIIAKLDRLSRSLRNLLNIYAEVFEKHNVSLVSVAEQFDTSTAPGRLFFQMVGSFAEFERAVISERTMGGRREKASRGQYVGGNPPIGYRSVRGSKTLTIDPEGAKLVRRVFAFRQEHPEWSLQRIADELTRKEFRGPTGAVLTRVHVKRILDREDFYRGRYSFAGVVADGQHKPILV